jgi:2-isopropylmalate synthase
VDVGAQAEPPQRARVRGLPREQREAELHDDGPAAVAEPDDERAVVRLAAVAAGAVQVQGTINGLGERCGNADLISVIANLALKLPGYGLLRGG